MPKSGLCLDCGKVNSVQNLESIKIKDKEVITALIDETLDQQALPLKEVEDVKLQVQEEIKSQVQEEIKPQIQEKIKNVIPQQVVNNRVLDSSVTKINSIVDIEPVVENSTILDNFTFEQDVESRLLLDRKSKKILQTCFQNLEKLKGGLVSKRKKKVKGQNRSFMLTSAHPKDGVTTGALATAIALSRYGKSKVLLVDVNASSPKLHQLFSIKSEHGFSDYISGKLDAYKGEVDDSSVTKVMDLSQDDSLVSWAKCTHYTEYHQLYVMPYSIDKSVSLWNVVGSADFQSRLEVLKSVFDYIVFDSSSVMGSSEPALLSHYTDGVILVLSAETTKWEVAELVINTVETAGGVFMGSILNRRKFYIPKFLYRWI